MTVEADIRNDALEQCAKIATNYALNQSSDCDYRGATDPETGEVSCSRERRGDTCLCVERMEVADAIASKIRAAKTS